MINYAYADCVTFWRSGDAFGGLSNMAGGYPITLGPYRARTSEHLYQALRFPDHPELQSEILAIASPLSAKRLAYQHLDATRSDWHDAGVKTNIMCWCLDLKLAQNYERFGALLRSTEGRDIVEASPVDDYWGAKPVPNGDQPAEFLLGWNVLGRLLLLSRRRLEIALPIDLRAAVIELPNFRLGGEDAMALALGK